MKSAGIVSCAPACDAIIRHAASDAAAGKARNAFMRDRLPSLPSGIPEMRVRYAALGRFCGVARARLVRLLGDLGRPVRDLLRDELRPLPGACHAERVDGIG